MWITHYLYIWFQTPLDHPYISFSIQIMDWLNAGFAKQCVVSYCDKGVSLPHGGSYRYETNSQSLSLFYLLHIIHFHVTGVVGDVQLLRSLKKGLQLV